MTRRIALLVLVPTVLTCAGGLAQAATPSSNDSNKQICVVVMGDPSNPARDGLCVRIPSGSADR